MAAEASFRPGVVPSRQPKEEWPARTPEQRGNLSRERTGMEPVPSVTSHGPPKRGFATAGVEVKGPTRTKWAERAAKRARTREPPGIKDYVAGPPLHQCLDQCLKDQCLDQCLQDQCLDQCLQDQCMMDQCMQDQCPRKQGESTSTPELFDISDPAEEVDSSRAEAESGRSHVKCDRNRWEAEELQELLELHDSGESVVWGNGYNAKRARLHLEACCFNGQVLPAEDQTDWGSNLSNSFPIVFLIL